MKKTKVYGGLLLACFCVLIAARAATAPAFEWIPLQAPAPSDKALNIIITGDGYTASDKSTFLADCQELVTGFNNKEPWKTYISHVNFYAAWVVSNQAGVSIRNGAQVDTAFKAVLRGMTEYTGGVAIDENIYAAYLAAVPVSGFHFFIINSTAYGVGWTGLYATIFRDGVGDMVGVAFHEAGHLIGGLDDEYLGGGTLSLSSKNVCTDLNNIPWKAWIDAGIPIPTPDSYGNTVDTAYRVGVYQGAATAAAYRPTYGSIMRGGYSTGEYGAVNSEALVLAIYGVTGPQLSITPAAGTVRISLGQQQAFTPVVWSAPSTIGVLWYLDGNYYTSGASLTLHYSDLTVGSHTLKCVVKDTTTMVRNDLTNLLTNTTTWTVVVGDVPIITQQPSNVAVMAGQAASFSVTATGTSLTYQWRKGGSVISGATATTYTLAAAQTGDAGSYDCVVTNGAGSSTSNTVTLTVIGSSSSSSGSSGGGACGEWYLMALAGSALLRWAIKRRRTN